MTSTALNEWRSTRAAVLQKLYLAHDYFATGQPGRQWLTEEINHSIIIRLAGEFQGFARDLHTEAVEHLFTKETVPDNAIRHIVQMTMQAGRQIDRNNARASQIGADFSRLGLQLWTQHGALEQRSKKRMKWHDALEILVDARNAIAHQNTDDLAKVLEKTRLNKATIVRWHNLADSLAATMDAIVGDYIDMRTGVRPW